MTKKFITSANLVNGAYTLIPSDRNKHLICTVGAKLIFPHYSSIKNVGLASLDDEVQITRMTAERVYFVDDDTTADIESDPKGQMVWDIASQNKSIMVQKIDNRTTYLVTGDTI